MQKNFLFPRYDNCTLLDKLNMQHNEIIDNNVE